ncbi:MAG: hypothetical protein HDP34_00865 [Clostridia bacterium]|nr:hypothetical protein [Clostridia bacterium]
MERTKSMQYQETDESTDLYLYATTSSDFYRNTIKPTIENLQKKAEKGTYDVEKAVDAYYQVACEAAKLYERQFGQSFTVADRFSAAVDMEENYRDDEILSTLVSKYGKYSPEVTKFQSSVFDALSQRTQAEGIADTFTIYQVNDKAAVEYRSPSYMQANRLAVDMKNYDKTYTAPLMRGMDLDIISAKFNNGHPELKRYLDTSDIIVLHRAGKDKAFWLDGIGFTDVTKDFLVTLGRQAAKETGENDQRPSLLENLHKKQEQIKNADRSQKETGIENRSHEKMDRMDAR